MGVNKVIEQKVLLAHYSAIWQEQSEVNAAAEKNKTLPKVLFKGKFGLSEPDFLQGLEDGEFFESEDRSGRKLYSWTQNEHTNVKTTTSKWSAQAERNLDKNQQKVQAAAFASWKIGLFKKVEGATSSGSKGPDAVHHLALVDAELSEKHWNVAQGQLKEAMSAFEKLDKQAKQCLQVVGVDAKEDRLYVALILGCIQKTYVK